MANLWCEARCDGIGTENCHETAPGAFGVRNAAQMAKDAGWKVIRDEWRCPSCAARAFAEKAGA